MNDIIVYTCITNGKDTLKEYPPEEGVRYICFTDGTVSPKTSQWKLQDLTWTHEDPRRISRYHKMHPNKVLPEHGISVWIDGSLVPRVRITDLVDRCGRVSYSARPHPGWNCIYTEAQAILRLGFDKPENIIPVVKRYQSEGFPPHFGLHETGVLIRHSTDEVQRFDEQWWKEVSENSKRDQMSFDYVRWKTGMEIGMIPKEWFFQIGHTHME